MRKLFIFLGIMVISLVLVGCTIGEGTITPPSYTGIRIEETNPVDGTDFVTFYRAKNETVEVEIGITNPSNLTIKSVVINGITYNSHRFLDKSTFSTVYFEMSVGTTLEETVYSVDKISYLDGENTKSIEGFSNNEFSIYVYKDLPGVERENYALTKNSVQIDFNVIDLDEVINTDTLRAELYSGETLVESIDMQRGLGQVLFDELLSNKSYEIKVVASYDLDDSNGVQQNTTLYTENYLTLSNVSPSASITSTEVESNSITFDVAFTDNDNVVIPIDNVEGNPLSLHAYIFNGIEQLTDIEYTVQLDGSTNAIVFDDLLNDNEYTIKIVADYDLKTGEDVYEDRVLTTYTFTTSSRSVPTPDIVGLNLLENSIEFGVEINDEFDVIFEDSLLVNLYVDGELTDSSELFVDDSYENLPNVDHYLVDLYITELFASSVIKIEIVADYFLNNGDPAELTVYGEVIHEVEYTTDINAIPSVDVESVIVEQGYFTVNMNPSDPNETMKEDFRIVLYEEEVEVRSTTFSIEDITVIFDYPTKSGLNYHVEIIGTYDLRDGNGIIEDQVLSTLYSYSKEDKAPVAEISNQIAGTESLQFDIKVIDADETVIPNSIAVYILLDGVVADFIDGLVVGSQTVQFNVDLFSNSEYEIVVKANYEMELKDGSIQLVEEDPINQETLLATLEKESPVATITDSIITKKSIEVEVEVIDDDEVTKPGTLFVVLVVDNVQDEATKQAIPVGPDSTVVFNNLYAEETYQVRVVSMLDYNDGVTLSEEQILVEEDFETLGYTPIEISVDDMRATSTTIEIDLDAVDTQSVYEENLEAVAYLDSTPMVVVPFSLGSGQTIILEGLEPDTEYYIVIEADIDLETKEGEIDNYELYGEFKFTEEAPSPTANLVSFDSETITINTASFDIAIDDDEGYLTDNIEATLRQYNGDEVMTFILTPNATTVIDLSNLLSNNTYELVLTTTYDPDTGIDEPYEYIHEFTTLPLDVPTVSINAVGSWTSTPDLTVQVAIGADTHNVASDTEWWAVLYQDGVEVMSVDIDAIAGNPEGGNTTVTFAGYDHTNPAFTYTVVITGALQLHELDTADPDYEAETVTMLASRTYIDAGN